MLVAYGGLVVSVSATFSAGRDLGSRVSVTLVKEETGAEGGAYIYIERERQKEEKPRDGGRPEQERHSDGEMGYLF